MEIDKKELSDKFIEKDYDYVFKVVGEISEFILIQKFKVMDQELREDIVQECNIAFLKKIYKGQVNPEKNMMSFIWQSSSWRIREIFRKENNRNRIAQINYFDDDDTIDYLNFSFMLDQNPETLELMGVV